MKVKGAVAIRREVQHPSNRNAMRRKPVVYNTNAHVVKSEESGGHSRHGIANVKCTRRVFCQCLIGMLLSKLKGSRKWERSQNKHVTQKTENGRTTGTGKKKRRQAGEYR